MKLRLKSISTKVLFSFIKLSGEDAYIVDKSSENTKLKIGGIGLLVSFILLLTFVTFFTTFYRLFENSIILSLTLSFFIGLMYFTLYQFLNYTLTKNVLPRVEEKISFFQKNISMILRIGFICFLAFVLGQILMVSILGNTIENEVIEFRKEKLQTYKDQTLIESTDNQNRLSKYSKELNQNYFFIERIKILESNPLAWVIIFGVIIVFILPIILKLTIGERYYVEKRLIEKALIEKHYNLFLNNYSKIMEGVNHENSSANMEGFSTVFSSKYIDAPFNTVLKNKSAYKSEEDFINKYFY
jgi:hypothetical protein